MGVRVLYWVENFPPSIGGVEVLSGQLLPDLQALGHTIEIVSSDPAMARADPESFEGMRVHRLPMRHVIQRRDLAGMRDCWETVARIKQTFCPQLVHLNTSGPSLFFHQKTTRVSPAPTIYTCHGLWTGTPPGAATAPENSLLAQVVRSADVVTAVSKAVARDAQRLGASDAALRVLYNGIRPPAEAPTPPTFDPPVFYVAGRMVRDKGVDTAIDAFALFARGHPDARLRIAGGGGELDALKAHAAASGASEAIRFLNWVPPERTVAELDAASAVLVPSRYEEPFGLVAAEAGLAGRPAVVTRSGGLPEIVVNEETGLVVAKEDPEGMSAAMERLVGDPVWATALGHAARSRVAKVFGWTRFVQAVDALYEEVATRRSSSGAACSPSSTP